MKKCKQILALFMTGIMILGMPGCGNGKDASKESENSGSKDLTVAIWDTYQEPGLKEIMNDFTNETGINVKIQVTPWDQYWTMMEAGATGGTLPDVFWMHSNQVAKYAKYDLLMDLSEYVEKSETVDLSKFPEQLVSLYQNQDGKQVAIPKDVDTVALWYNKTAFDNAGLAYPDDTWTWDTFRDAAKALTKEDGSQYGTVFSPKSNHETYYNLIYDWGGNIINEDGTVSGWDDPKTLEAMEFVKEMIDDGSMPPYTTIAENEPLALFESGKVAMGLFGSWQSDLFSNDYIKENCDVAVLPKKDDTRISIYNGLGWAASADSPNKESAWKLIEYLGSEAAQKKQADLGVTMSAYENTSDGFVNKNENFNLQAYIDMLDDIVIRPYSMDTVVWENMSLETLVKAWDGTAEMEDTCKEIAAKMNESLEKENAQ